MNCGDVLKPTGAMRILDWKDKESENFRVLILDCKREGFKIGKIER